MDRKSSEGNQAGVSRCSYVVLVIDGDSRIWPRRLGPFAWMLLQHAALDARPIGHDCATPFSVHNTRNRRLARSHNRPSDSYRTARPQVELCERPSWDQPRLFATAPFEDTVCMQGYTEELA